jgi:hypothetical protein
MAEGGGISRWLGVEQVLTTVMAAMVMTLLVWAWNLTQDVRILMDGRTRLGKVEEIIDSGRDSLEDVRIRLTKVEQRQGDSLRLLPEIYARIDQLSQDLGEAKAQISAMQAMLPFMRSPPPER